MSELVHNLLIGFGVLFALILVVVMALAAVYFSAWYIKKRWFNRNLDSQIPSQIEMGRLLEMIKKGGKHVEGAKVRWMRGAVYHHSISVEGGNHSHAQATAMALHAFINHVDFDLEVLNGAV